MYKIIKDNKIIDIVSYADFIRFFPNGRIDRTCKDLAEGIVGSDLQTIYSFIPITGQNYDTVSVKEISLEEFNKLSSLLNSNQEIYDNTNFVIQTRNKAIKKLSDICKNKIEAGFNIKLSDGLFYNFKLTTEDQLNLLSLENRLCSDEESFIYHATGQPCRVFAKDDLLMIIKAFRKHVLYHTTYFNTAKQYINSLDNIKRIENFTYGDNLSTFATSKVIKQIIKNGDGNK